MNRVKSRRRALFMLIVFMLIFSIGSVFAFVSNGGLVLTGTATVNFNNSARLYITYNGHEVHAAQANAAQTAVTVSQPGNDGTASVTFSTVFVVPGRVVYNFQIENTGTICAIIRSADSGAGIIPDWGITVNVLDSLYGRVIPAGSSENFSIEVMWNLPEYTEGVYAWINTFGGLLGGPSGHSFTTTLHYEMYFGN